MSKQQLAPAVQPGQAKQLKKQKKRPGRRLAWLRRDWQLYAMMAIPIIWYLVFCYKPMTGLVIAFQKYNIFKGIKGSQWVGLENFKFVFQMRDFGIALKNTLWLNFLDLLVGFPIPIILAIMLNEMRTPGSRRSPRPCCTCPISCPGSSSAAWC